MFCHAIVFFLLIVKQSDLSSQRKSFNNIKHTHRGVKLAAWLHSRTEKSLIRVEIWLLSQRKKPKTLD
ncbi:hypothetical protein Y1Q_0011229 [Alligator mississippiensis]|uniref:Secreted protein n=1 Tax=Alligator mississippiensis TaxID=8496 RepID=A0A151N112_ALLMI|nr:hypothetical protein Y1Q_0011229 [Alligator mississippiensis]